MAISSPNAVARRGLTSAEVVESRRQHGSNLLTPAPRDPWWKLYLEKFEDPVIRILIIAAVIAIAVGAAEGHYAEGVGIVIAILLSTGLAFLNEFRAAREFDILNQTSDDVAVKVFRDDNFTTVPRRDVVVGDLVQIEVGEEVPADGRLVEGVALLVNEARLTGESRPVEKSLVANASSETAYAVDRLLRGTTIVDGTGLYEVAAVGDQTEIGTTARAAAEKTDEVTPLNRQLERLSKFIGVIGLGIATLTFYALVGRGAWSGTLTMTAVQWYFALLLIASASIALVKVWGPIVYDGLHLAGVHVEPPHWIVAEGLMLWLKALLIGSVVFVVGLLIGTWFGLPWTPGQWLPGEAAASLLAYFMISVTIIVVAVPEGLAMSVTLSLAYSMRRMTAANTLVRRMHACETIGAATVICSDKTGTLTMNEMRVVEVHMVGQVNSAVPQDTARRSLVAEAISANTTAQLDRTPGAEVKPIGNPTEGALLLWLQAAGVDYVPIRTGFATDVQLTFTTERKFMATLGRSAASGQRVLHVKGAPEIVIDRCTTVATTDGVRPLAGERDVIRAAIKNCQVRGMRTLAFAYAPCESGQDVDQLAHDMTWLGFVAIADPVRPEVPAAIAACRGAGVGVKIVTGDSPETGKEIARQIGLIEDETDNRQFLKGVDFAELSDADAAEAADHVRVLARARPADKLRLVRLLQAKHHVVAVTGDGVNDGPALNYANVGLAMGKTGTAVAKEASDIILLDDSFQSIVNAILWGRSLYENIQRFVLFQLTINVAALGLAFLGPFLGYELPLTVMQMLWINLIMDTFAALALATEAPNPMVLNRPPRDPKAFIVTPVMARGIFATAGIFLVVLIAFTVYLVKSDQSPHGNEPTWGGTVLFTVFVLLQFWNLFNARSLGHNRSAFYRLGDNPAFLAIAAAILIGQVLLVQFGGTVFRTTPLSATDWLLLLVITAPVLLIGEAVRALRRKGPAGV